MRPRHEAVLWGCTVMVAIAAATVWRSPIANAAFENGVTAMPAIVFTDTARVQRSVRAVIAADPFRLTREPSPLPFRPFSDRIMQMAATTPQAPKPVLVLRGIVGGPPWEALIEGFPGRNGAVVVRSGEKHGDFVVRAIKKDTVVVQGMDTTWRLAMVRAWQ